MKVLSWTNLRLFFHLSNFYILNLISQPPTLSLLDGTKLRPNTIPWSTSYIWPKSICWKTTAKGKTRSLKYLKFAPQRHGLIRKLFVWVCEKPKPSHTLVHTAANQSVYFSGRFFLLTDHETTQELIIQNVHWCNIDLLKATNYLAFIRQKSKQLPSKSGLTFSVLNDMLIMLKLYDNFSTKSTSIYWLSFISHGNGILVCKEFMKTFSTTKKYKVAYKNHMRCTKEVKYIFSLW